ncbi:hypothetical protein AB0O32_15560 [Streptomyces rubiginosohelvolus]|uniref:hypothetical protein n=1 Tax=Streptomyces rubiginosohelvolus TaxID=67362 RepID=UPI00344813BC
MSTWPHDARVVFRLPSHCRKVVAYLICSLAKRRMVGVMWLRSARNRSPGGREEPDRLGVLGLGDFGQVAGEPALEGTEVLVDRGQDSAGHEEFLQVGGHPPGLEFVEGIVGQRDLAQAEPAKQLRGVSQLPAAHVQPCQSASGLVHRHQQVEQRGQRGTDAARAVVEKRGEAVGERAAFAEPTA